MPKRKAHVIERRGQQGMFHKEFWIECRCGWETKHYNSGHVTKLFKEHQAKEEASESDSSVAHRDEQQAEQVDADRPRG